MAFSADDWANCPQRTHNPPRRTSGANIPGCAQGAIFPGDEACNACNLTGELCEERPDVETCPLVEEPRLLPCPFCEGCAKLVGGGNIHGLGTWQVYCQCGASGPDTMEGSDLRSRVQAALDWNHVVGAKA